MSVVRRHNYSVDPADLSELLARRGALIAAIRAAHPGLARTQLIQLNDGTYADTWQWDSAEQLSTAFADIGSFPDAPLALALTTGRTRHDGIVIDER